MINVYKIKFHSVCIQSLLASSFVVWLNVHFDFIVPSSGCCSPQTKSTLLREVKYNHKWLLETHLRHTTMPGINRQPSHLKHMQYLVRNILGFRIISGPGLRQTDAKRGRKRKNRCRGEKHPKCVLERPCSSQPCPARGKPGSLVPRQDLAVSWKMRTLQRQSPRNKKNKKKQHCLPASMQLRGTCASLHVCI